MPLIEGDLVSGVVRGRVRAFIDAKSWVVRENLNDVGDAAANGYFQELIHLVGAESPSVISQRMAMRRTWARGVLRGETNAQPNLPKITRGRLSLT